MAKIHVLECGTRADMRAFLRCEMPRRAFTQTDQACDLHRNALLRMRRHAFLLALDNGKPVARLLLMDDGKRAWFSLLHLQGQEDAQALFERAGQIARDWGALALFGPVSPDGSGFGLGLCLPGSQGCASPWHSDTPEQWVHFMNLCGFERSVTLMELVAPCAKNPYERAAEWAKERIGLTITSFSLREREGCKAAFAASEDAAERGFDAFARYYARCGELARHGRALVAYVANKPIGWLLVVPEQGGVVRFLHMQILSPYRRGPCAAALLDTAWRMALARGARELRASTIDAQNGNSLRMAINAGGRICRTYGIFRLGL